MCELKFEHSQYFFGEDITSNIKEAKDMSKIDQNPTKDYSQCSHKLIQTIRISS